MSEMPSRMAQGSQSDKEERGTRAGHYGRRVPVSHARIFPSLVRALGWRVADQDYGTSTPVSLASYDHATQSWRTSERYLFEDLTQFWDRLPKSGMMRNGKIYALPMSERPTEGSDCGLWPTPKASDAFRLRIKIESVRKTLRKRLTGVIGSPPYLEAYLDKTGLLPHSESVEWTMGYPRSWTELNASEIRLSLKSRN
jgi:hypothetical protein